MLILAVLLVTTFAGVMVIAIAFRGARMSQAWADPLLWTGLLLILLPITLRLLGQSATRNERLALVLLLGLALYSVKVLLSPAGFTLHDELGHYRSVADLLRTGRLYVRNPVVPAYSYYPGILSVTAALSRMSGLGIFTSGLVVIGVARLLLMGGLFLLVQQITRSSRIAGIAVVFYTANPNFVFFDSQFSYESFALGLAAMALWATARAADEESGNWRDVAVAALFVGALVLSHHLTSYAVALVIAIWAMLTGIRRFRSPPTRRLALLALFTLGATGAYAVFAFHATASDIGGSLVGSIHGLLNIVTGTASGKAPFTAAPGYTDPPLERATGLLAVGLLLAALPFGLYAVWRQRPIDFRLGVLAVAALLYPASLAVRLTAAGTETSNRTSEFLFAGIGTVLALAFVTRLGKAADQPGKRSVGLRLLVAAYAGLVFAGGIIVGTPPYDRLPAGYEVSADSRSIDAEAVTAARWAARWLPANARFLADEDNGEVLTAYTRLAAQSGSVGHVRVGELFTSPTFGAEARHIILFDKLRFLVVDRRDSTALPRTGHYFDSGDPVSSYSRPIPAEALAKFDTARCVDRIFSSGNIVIYSTRRLLGGCR